MKIRQIATRLVKSWLTQADLRLSRTRDFSELSGHAALGRKAVRLGFVSDDRLRQTLDLLAESQSQTNQDFFVLEQLGWKRDGYFVEFGTADGKNLSNSWLLEKGFGWRGILAEPGRIWHQRLQSSGRTAVIESDCVWKRTGAELTFLELGKLSTIGGYAEKDSHDRSGAVSYKVATVSLLDLLRRHDAPMVVDYLSIDTEGSELAILEAFDFDQYRFRCLTCEHNFTPDRERIHELLSGKGYRRVLAEISEMDDWYIHEGAI